MAEDVQTHYWGYVRGSFTGAVVKSAHKELLRFDSAHEAYLFLIRAGWSSWGYYPAHGMLFQKPLKQKRK